MDVIKQREIAAAGTRMSYFQGMISASNRDGLTPLGSDYKEMRNDIVHEGVLSASNFPGKSKADCASVIADTLKWPDEYILAVVGLTSHVSNSPRWRSIDLELGLPAISLR
jgi:hypothetical protein